MVLVATIGLAQPQDVTKTPSPTFEVASVKPSNAETRDSGGASANDRLTMRNVTLKRCIRGAYGVPEAQILGGPNWLDQNRYDIEAKASGSVGDHELMIMLQSLLADRFNLVLHREKRALAGYSLVLGKALKVKPSEPGAGCRSNSRRGGVDAEGCTTAQLALKLSEALHLPVADSTGVQGKFDFKLEWTPDDMQAKPGLPEVASGPSIFTAVQEQLGLKLESRKVPVEVLVIDHAEPPSQN
jgi:uncharacterized protein (TIGR03435 family)